MSPSRTPSAAPTQVPTHIPSYHPIQIPTNLPSAAPTSYMHNNSFNLTEQHSNRTRHHLGFLSSTMVPVFYVSLSILICLCICVICFCTKRLCFAKTSTSDVEDKFDDDCDNNDDSSCTEQSIEHTSNDTVESTTSNSAQVDFSQDDLEGGDLNDANHMSAVSTIQHELSMDQTQSHNDNSKRNRFKAIFHRRKASNGDHNFDRITASPQYTPNSDNRDGLQGQQKVTTLPNFKVSSKKVQQDIDNTGTICVPETLFVDNINVEFPTH